MTLFHRTLVLAVFLLGPLAARAEEPKIRWQPGPVEVSLGDPAAVHLPAGFLATGKDGTKQLLQATGNLVSGDEVGAIVPVASDSMTWFAIFEYRSVGYVSDSEKDSIDADALLRALQEQNARGNEERRRRHLETMTLTGWEEPPYYDPATHNLTWAVVVVSDSGAVSVNHSVRLLGRHGTMDVDLVLAPAIYHQALPHFDSVLANFEFREGHRYADFVKGDKVAAFGLTALVAGGVGAVAAKTGLLAGLWKVLLFVVLALKKAIVVLVLGAVAFFRKLFAGFKRTVDPTETVPGADDAPRPPTAP